MSSLSVKKINLDLWYVYGPVLVWVGESLDSARHSVSRSSIPSAMIYHHISPPLPPFSLQILVTRGGFGIDVRLGDRSKPLFHVIGRSVGSLFRDKEVVLTCCLIDHSFDFEPSSDHTISAGEEDARQSRMSRQLQEIMEGLRQCKIKLASPSSASSTTTSHPSPVHSTEI